MPISRSIPASVALVALLVGVTACGPSPKDVCDHVVGLMDAELKAKGAELAADKRTKSLESCIDRANENKKESAVEYKKEAACVMAATTLDEVKACSDPGAAKAE